MITLKVYNGTGAEVGTVDVDEADFGGEVNRQLLHDVVVMHLANQRAGTHSTLRRGEVAGSTRKLFRQKGTGRARRGTLRTNKVKGGGTAKGPKPRDYEYHLPKKMVKAATRMAILSKLKDQETVVLDDLKLTQPKTKEVATILKALKLTDTTCLLGLDGYNNDIYRAARNIRGMVVMPTSQFNAYTVLKQKRLILTRAALEALRKPAASSPGANTSGSPTTTAQ
jgi:large subunit ribosomal protein L4